MLKSVEVHKAYDESFQFPEPLLTLPVTEPNPSVPYIVTNIEGLGPVVADFSSASYPNGDGGVIQSSRVGMRNIVLSIMYRPDYSAGGTVEDLRTELYRLFPPTVPMDLRFRRGPGADEVYRIQVYVESHEPDIFAKDPTVKISLICPDPYFSSIQETRIEGTTEMTIELEGKLGTAPTGLKFESIPDRTVARFTLYNYVDPLIEWYGRVLSGDGFFLSTVRGNKYIYHTSGDTGESRQAISGLSSRSSLSMFLGPETKYFSASVNLEPQVNYTLVFTKKWVGL